MASPWVSPWALLGICLAAMAVAGLMVWGILAKLVSDREKAARKSQEEEERKRELAEQRRLEAEYQKAQKAAAEKLRAKAEAELQRKKREGWL